MCVWCVCVLCVVCVCVCELNLTLHCHHHNDFCSTVGGDESRVNVTFMERGKVMRLSINLNVGKERRAEPTSAR